MYLFIRRVIRQTIIIIEAFRFCELSTVFYLTFCGQGEHHMQRNLLGIISMDFDATGELLIIYFAVIKYLRKKWEYNEAVHQLIIDFKEACNLVRREVLYDIIIGFGIPMKLARLIKLCLNETCSRVRVGNNLSDMFLVQNGSR